MRGMLIIPTLASVALLAMALAEVAGAQTEGTTVRSETTTRETTVLEEAEVDETTGGETTVVSDRRITPEMPLPSAGGISILLLAGLAGLASAMSIGVLLAGILYLRRAQQW